MATVPRPKNRGGRVSNSIDRPVAVHKLYPWTDLWIAILLVAGIAIVYGQVVDHEFLNYDDPVYVTANPIVRNGLTLAGVRWAFTSAHDANWIPLTWLSHTLDCQLFGVHSVAQHLTNVFLHATNTLLLFFLLKRMTGARWPSAFVAALFALHPLHVESVAWIAERKDVLCTFFFFLTIYAYLRCVERPTAARYTLVAALFICTLMSKPMGVTLPIVLILLDFWPLRRAQALLGIVLEKLPLFALSVVIGVVAFLAQHHAGAVAVLEHVPLGLRIENAIVSYIAYIGVFIWPANLAVFYPYPASIPAWQWICAVIGLATCTVFVLKEVSRWPFLAVGWLWFLMTLLPVIGLIQVGSQSRADRYTYIPLVGIGIMLAWSLQRLGRSGAIIATAACVAWAATAWHNVQYWHDTLALFEHAAQSTTNNYVAYTNIADQLRATGHVEEAIPWFERAYHVRPDEEQVLYNLGASLQVAGRNAEAMSILTNASNLHPDSYKIHVALADAAMRAGAADRAAAEYKRALQLRSDGAEANYGLGGVLMSQGRPEEAR